MKTTDNPEVKTTSTVRLDGINSTFWETIVRPTILKRDGYKCVNCLNTENLEIHKKSYTEITWDNMETLCKGCHKKEHINNGFRRDLK